MDIWLPLQGPNGVRPKAPAHGAWQSPGYQGIDPTKFSKASTWIGLRTDDYVVVDCDNDEARDLWLYVTGISEPTWVRKTPHGYHFIYLATPGSPEGPSVGVFPHVDIRAGRTSQIVFYAPGYSDLSSRANLRKFDPAWLPERIANDVPEDETWTEMPDGRGNNTMTALAGAMRKQGMNIRAVAQCLGAINRITMTRDPMPNEMLVDIARSVCRYKPDPDIDLVVE